MKTCECGCGAEIADRLRFVNGHNHRKSGVDYVEEDRGYDSPCWIWQRSINNRGYGICRRDGKWHTAHRRYYEQRHGTIPEGLQLDHLCRNRACCNPDHLEPVTQAINQQRGSSAKLTEAKVRQIRASNIPSRKLATMLGVSHTAVNDVRSGRRWSNVA